MSLRASRWLASLSLPAVVGDGGEVAATPGVKEYRRKEWRVRGHAGGGHGREHRVALGIGAQRQLGHFAHRGRA